MILSRASIPALLRLVTKARSTFWKSEFPVMISIDSGLPAPFTRFAVMKSIARLREQLESLAALLALIASCHH